VKIREKHQEAIHMMILDRFSKSRLTAQIAQQLGVTKQAVNYWRADDDFQAEYQKQLRIYQQDFSDIKLADRKERVKVLSAMFEHIPEPRVSLRLKVLEQIRQEVGDDRIQIEHTVEVLGPNMPPRAQSYAEWLIQNEQMQAAVALLEDPAVEAEFEVEG
jgi:hypothetical protein